MNKRPRNTSYWSAFILTTLFLCSVMPLQLSCSSTLDKDKKTLSDTSSVTQQRYKVPEYPVASVQKNSANTDSPFGIFGPYELLIDGHDQTPPKAGNNAPLDKTKGYSSKLSDTATLDQLVFQYQRRLSLYKAQGQDTCEAEYLDKRSREVFAAGDSHQAKFLLSQALSKLEETPQVTNVERVQPSHKPNAQLFSITKKNINYFLQDLHVPWVQEMPQNILDLPATINIYTRVGREGGFKPTSSNLIRYKTMLQQFVARTKHRVKYYEADTEPSGFPPPLGWQGHPDAYVNFLQTTYETIKNECPECKVVLGGMVGVGSIVKETKSGGKGDLHTQFLESILEKGAGQYFDVFSFKHHHCTAEDYKSIGDRLLSFKKTLSKFNIDLDVLPVFLETATYDGAPGYPAGHPLSFITFRPQSEKEQASGLVKIFIYSLSLGIDKIFWNELVERHDFGNIQGNPFNYYGLVNNPKNDGKSHRKLAYYSFKNLIHTFIDADWQKMKILVESKNLSLYLIPVKANSRTRVEKKNRMKKIWVAWNDTGTNQKITISNIHSATVLLTSTVPEVQSGIDIQEGSTPFPSRLIKVHHHTISLKTSIYPVIIKEL